MNFDTTGELSAAQEASPPISAAGREGWLGRLRLALTPLNVACATLCLVYAFFFVRGISEFWFNRQWTTDDALQQAFPFHKVYHPQIFAGDLVTEAMQGYLAPLDWWLGCGITWLVKNPIMTCHWLMLIQVVLTVAFLFFAVKHVVGAAPAWLAVAWLLHTRPVMQRITGGLPRGWAAPVLTGFLFFAFTGRHKGMLVFVLCACLLHPPAAVMIGAAYGMLLLLKLRNRAERPAVARKLIGYLLLIPVYAGVLFIVAHRPQEMGQMVDYQTAAAMPEFQYPLGRFPFLPFDSVQDDLKMYGFQPFFHRLHRPGFGPAHPLPGWKEGMMLAVPCLLALAWYVGRRRGRGNVFPLELLCMLAAIALVYAASRQFAFKLYVPNRHLQFPLTVFLIGACTIVPWAALHAGADLRSSRWKESARSAAALLVVLVLVLIGTGAGFDGSANFNFPLYKRGGVFAWLKTNTPERALVAGHPVHIDPVQLFAMRRGYATIETTHPFYLGYYNEMKRRLIVSIKAHYARSLDEIVDLLAPEGIDYFVFSRRRFYPEALKKEKMFAPLDGLMKELASRGIEQYAYKDLPAHVDLARAPYMPYRDGESVVIDVKLLREHLRKEAR